MKKWCKLIGSVKRFAWYHNLSSKRKKEIAFKLGANNVADSLLAQDLPDVVATEESILKEGLKQQRIKLLDGNSMKEQLDLKEHEEVRMVTPSKVFAMYKEKHPNATFLEQLSALVSITFCIVSVGAILMHGVFALQGYCNLDPYSYSNIIASACELMLSPWQFFNYYEKLSIYEKCPLLNFKS
jgi:hypothetical protein